MAEAAIQDEAAECVAVIPRLGPEKSDLRVFCWPRGLGTVARGTQGTIRAP